MTDKKLPCGDLSLEEANVVLSVLDAGRRATGNQIDQAGGGVFYATAVQKLQAHVMALSPQPEKTDPSTIPPVVDGELPQDEGNRETRRRNRSKRK